MASASPSSLNLCHFALLTAFLCHTSLLTGGEVGELGYILCTFQSFSCLRASTHAVPRLEHFLLIICFIPSQPSSVEFELS